MMNAGDSRHIFIFHSDDDDPGNNTDRQREIVVAGEAEGGDHYFDIFEATAAETKDIRSRSVCIDNAIHLKPNLAIHLWPDKKRNIKASTLHYVVRHLRGTAPPLSGTKHLELLASICTVVWALKCDRGPFLSIARQILRDWDGKNPETYQAEQAKWLAIITFVLGKDLQRDSALEGCLGSLIWHSDASLEFSVGDLQIWFHDIRRKILDDIYTFFQEHMRKLEKAHPHSSLVESFLSNVTGASNGSGHYIDFDKGWSSQIKGEQRVTKMSPKGLTEYVLNILKAEYEDENTPTGGQQRSVSAENGVIDRSGFRPGRGGDFFRLMRALTARQEKDKDNWEGVSNVAESFKGIVQDAEFKMAGEWRRLEPMDINKLIAGRNEELERWNHGRDVDMGN